MFQFSADAIFIAVTIVGILVIITTLGCLITSTVTVCLMSKIRKSEEKYRALRRTLSASYDIPLETLKTRLDRQGTLVKLLFSMMDDASNTELSGEEISTRIKDKIKASGVKVTHS